MSSAPRTLPLVYPDPGAFCEQYARNLSHGGGFVPTTEHFEARELVEICLDAPFADEVIRLRAEVVHQEPMNGVSVQFLAPAAVIRAQLAEILGRARALAPAPAPPVPAPGEESFEEDRSGEVRRFGWAEDSEALQEDPNERTHYSRAVRYAMRMGVRVRVPGAGDLPGRTRNVSRSGLLLSVPGEGMAVGAEIDVALISPLLEAPVEVAARVVRQLQAPGAVPGIAVAMQAAAREREISHLIEEHVRALCAPGRRSLSDRFGAGGAGSVLRFIAGLPETGTLIFEHGPEEALVVVGSGCLRAAEIGPARGLKALARILAWPEGSYELCEGLLLPADPEPPLPIDEAIARALELAERPMDAPVLAADACFTVHRSRLEALHPSLSAAETAVLSLAGRGFTLRRILDGAPESDGALLRALLSLLDQRIVTLR